MQRMLSSAALILFVALAVPGRASYSQPGVRDVSADSVTVVLKERFPQAHIAAIVRRTSGSRGADIVAMRRSAVTPELLAMALATVASSRAQQGESVSRTVTVIIPVGIKYPPLATTRRQTMTDVINRLRSATPQSVPGVGQVPVVRTALEP